MINLSQSIQEIRSLPDEVLQQELSSPSGMLPGYLVLGELNERRSVRGGGDLKKRPSMVEEITGSKPTGMPTPTPSPMPSYSEGGLIRKLNPFAAYVETLGDPKAAGKMQQEQRMDMHGNQPPPMTLQRPQSPNAPPNLSLLIPQRSSAPQRVDPLKMGIGSLMP